VVLVTLDERLVGGAQRAAVVEDREAWPLEERADGHRNSQFIGRQQGRGISVSTARSHLRRRERSEAISISRGRDCFVAALLAMTSMDSRASG
jgi:hypothetical protein